MVPLGKRAVLLTDGNPTLAILLEGKKGNTQNGNLRSGEVIISRTVGLQMLCKRHGQSLIQTDPKAGKILGVGCMAYAERTWKSRGFDYIIYGLRITLTRSTLILAYLKLGLTNKALVAN